MDAPAQILTAEAMRSAEQALIDSGETVSSLMERAGRGAAEWVYRMAAGRPVTVLCGPGNNGGDGYVIARVLAERGVPVSLVAPLAPRTEAAFAARTRWGGVPVDHAYGHVFVDCLFGTGLTRPLSEELRDLLLDLVRSHDRRVAVDLPSGVDSDSGAFFNERLPSYDLTVALGAWKFAHWLMPASAAMGERRLVDIGVAPVGGAAQLLERPRLAPPAADAHKYSRGLLGVVGGAMAGAGVLASGAAMRAGAGYVKLLAPRSHPAAPADLVVDERPLGEALSDSRFDALLVGPGLGRDAEAKSRLVNVLQPDLPTVCDADALMLLDPAMLAGRSAPLILTPHAGELAQLASAFAIAAGPRAGQVQALARGSGAVVVAKGPDTLVASPDGALAVAPPAPAWLSTAGTGDVLAGIIASRLAAGSRADEAAGEGVWLHGEAARRCPAPFTARELILYVTATYRACL